MCEGKQMSAIAAPFFSDFASIDASLVAFGAFETFETFDEMARNFIACG